MGTFDNAREVLEELNAMALESDCGLIDTPEKREEALRRINKRKTVEREKRERDAAAERAEYDKKTLRWY
jgi:hypothetical protein